MRPRAKVTIESLQKVIYEKSISTKMNDLDLCLQVVSRCIDFVDIARRSSARGLQLLYNASRGFVSDSWAFLFTHATLC